MKITTSDLDKLNSTNPRVKYGFTKELLKIGAEAPENLYEHFDYWTKMFNSDNNILKWTAIDIIGYISAVDKDNKTDKKITGLIEYLHGGHLITCNHAIFALGMIAKNKPRYRTKIIKELLAVSNDKFDTTECRNIAVGKVIETLGRFVNDIKNNKDVLSFIKRAQRCRRDATKKKASSLLKKIEKAA